VLTALAIVSLPNIAERQRSVCAWHLADILVTLGNVRFWGKIGHRIRRDLQTKIDYLRNRVRKIAA
jgi:hypothetical protein